MTHLDSGQQLVLGFIALVSAGILIGAWSWHRAMRAEVKVRAALSAYERQVALDQIDDALIEWNQQVWAELDRSGL